MFISNLSTHMVLIMILSNVIKFYKTESINNNVGTVLFSITDLNKDCWTTDELKLLRARHYFQDILPPPLLVDSVNEYNVNLLFNYFLETYTAVKKETSDPIMHRLLTTALSDCVGGYIRVWVLPIAKFAFYSGTISKDNVLRLFVFYDEIKKYLGTDGEGWHKPNKNRFKLSINTIKPIIAPASSKVDQNFCDHLLFFEKTSDGLTAPIPYVNWEGASSKLFLPLKNHSIYAMSSPNSSSVLLKYYHTAKYCLKRESPQLLQNFELRFQSWLANEILPHLADDNVYLALGSILTAMNITQSLYDSVLYLYENNPHPSYKMWHVSIFSKKIMIVTLLVFIEVIWCCLALIYTCYVKRKKDRNCNLQRDSTMRQAQNKCFVNQEKFDRRPFGMKEVGNVTSKGNITHSKTTEIETLCVKEKPSKLNYKTQQPAMDALTSIGVVTQDSFIIRNPKKLHKDIEQKKNSTSKESLSAEHCNPTYTTLPKSNIKTIGNRFIKHRNDNQMREKGKHNTNKKNKIIDLSNNTTGMAQNSATNMYEELKISKSKSCISNVDVNSNKQFNETLTFKPSALFDIFETTLRSSRSRGLKFSTDPCLADKMEYTERYIKSEDVLNSHKNMAKSVTFFDKGINIKNAPDCTNVSSRNEKIIKPIEKLMEGTISVEDKQSAATYTLTTAESNSIASFNSKQIVYKKSQKEYENEGFANTLDLDCIKRAKMEPSIGKSEYIKVIEPEPSLLELTCNKDEEEMKIGREQSIKLHDRTKRLDVNYVKKPYWEIRIDEPQKDVYVDIKGTLKLDSANQKKSKIPKLSVKTILETRPISIKSKGKTLIPQPIKRVVDDMALAIIERKKKLNTSL